MNLHFVYDLVVVLCFHNLNERTNFESYNDRKKSANVQELLYRIIVAHRRWMPKPNKPIG